MTTSKASRDGLDDLIGAVYDCVIDPSRWHDTLDDIRRRFHFYNVMLAVNNTVTHELVMSVTVNISAKMAAVAEEYSGHIGELWGGWARANTVPLEEPVTCREFISREALEANPYYQHFAVPQGIYDSLAIGLVRDSQTISNIGMGRHKSAPPLTGIDLDELRILARHLRRAVVIGRILETSVNAARSFAEALDASPAGVVLIDGLRRVVHANSAAKSMLAAADPITNANVQLELPAEVVRGSFKAAMVSTSGVTVGGVGAGIPARRADGRPLTVQVLPLGRHTGSFAPSHAVAAVFVADSASGHATSPDILSVLFDLTPAETRVFGLIVEGFELPAIGMRLGISPATAKTHLARVYQKTGENSRASLVRLAAEIAPPSARSG